GGRPQRGGAACHRAGRSVLQGSAGHGRRTLGHVLAYGAARQIASAPCHACRFENGSMTMNKVTYQIVEHDGGWAYKLGDVYSETFRTHEEALNAARAAAAEQ